MNDEALTIEDLLNKDADEIISNITIDNTKDKLKSIKGFLKGYFTTDHVLIKAKWSVLVDGEYLEITRVLPSTGRVFLKWKDREFSVTRDYLTGEEWSCPFIEGDEVVTKDNIIGVVQKIIKSSNKAVVKLENNEEKALPIGSLQKLVNESVAVG